MRVLHVSPYFAPAFRLGGPPRSILALCKAQQVAGLDVEVLTTTANGSRPLAAAPSGTTYDGVPVRYLPLRGPFFWSPSLGAALRTASPKADIIHTHGLFNVPAWQAHRAAAAAGRRLVVSVRGMLEPHARSHHAWRKRVVWPLLDRQVCDDAAFLHTTSATETRNVQATLPGARVVEIPNAIELPVHDVGDADTQAMRRRLNLDPAAPFVLFLGRLAPIKRLDLLAQAFAQVARECQEVRLVIAGEGDGRLRAAANALLGDARAHVVWAGPVEGVERDALLENAATLVLCSDSENFGMSVAEALARGLAPVVTRTCPWEVLEREGAGLWVPQTAEAIAAGLLQILRHPDQARAMGERGRRLVADRFALSVVGHAWADAYARAGT